MNLSLKLATDDCRDCYKCIRNCLIKAIRYSNGHAEIIQSECIQCGECIVACPRHLNEIDTDVAAIRKAIRAGKKVVASVAPAFIADFDVGSVEDFRDALKQLGFYDVQETAIGAELASREYEKMMREGNRDVVISSTCPAICLLIRKFYPDMLKYLTPVQTPMEIHCQMLYDQYPDAMIVYITPCYSERIEAAKRGCCDGVLLFSDVKKWLTECGVTTVNSGRIANRTGMRSRRYPRQDGIIQSMERVPGWNRVSIDGVGDCLAALEEMRLSKISHVFMEMTACEGSCVNGPNIRSNRYENRIRGTVAVNNYAGDNDFGIKSSHDITREFTPLPVERTKPSEEEVEELLKRMNKDTYDTALNCGCCGYPTCREMASAICQGKAEPDMCLPYLKERAERHSREIIDSTLEAADQVIDKQMRVVQNIASILGETTAETKVMLVKLKEAIQDNA